MSNGYTVDSIAQSFSIGGDGGLQDTVAVTFRTDAGDTGQVRVPLVDGWQDQASQQIQAQVAAYNQLRGGSSSAPPPPLP